MRDWRRLHEFWFGAPGTPEARLTARLPLWFLKDGEADAAARREFAAWLDEYRSGQLESWRETPRGTLTLVVLLDQIPRNAFRGRPESFGYDADALSAALEAIARDWDRELSTLERLFLYLPVEHSEEPAMQRLSVAKFEALHESAPAELGEFTRLVLEYAHQHEKVITRFGRYPHRNDILGRPSTEAERAFLLEPGSAF